MLFISNFPPLFFSPQYLKFRAFQRIKIEPTIGPYPATTIDCLEWIEELKDKFRATPSITIMDSISAGNAEVEIKRTREDLTSLNYNYFCEPGLEAQVASDCIQRPIVHQNEEEMFAWLEKNSMKLKNLPKIQFQNVEICILK